MTEPNIIIDDAHVEFYEDAGDQITTEYGGGVEIYDDWIHTLHEEYRRWVPLSRVDEIWDRVDGEPAGRVDAEAGGGQP
jgi:hypothetical protein